MKYSESSIKIVIVCLILALIMIVLGLILGGIEVTKLYECL